MTSPAYHICATKSPRGFVSVFFEFRDLAGAAEDGQLPAPKAVQTKDNDNDAEPHEVVSATRGGGSEGGMLTWGDEWADEQQVSVH